MAGKPHSSFDQDPTTQKKATEAAKSPEARQKAHNTRLINKAVKTGVYDSLRNMLLSPDKKGHIYYEQFLQKFLEEAKKNPESKAAQVVANTILKEDILDQLDESVEKAIARDTEFMEYRIVKTLFDKQRDVLFDNLVRRKVIMCSRRAGKTELAKRQLVYTCTKPNSPCIYINLTFANAINQCFDGVVELAEYIGLEITRQSKVDGYIEFQNGSSIKFHGNSNVTDIEKLRGYKARLVIIDEAQSQRMMRYLVDDVISPLLMDYTDSVLVLQGTPPRIAKTYFEDAYVIGNNSSASGKNKSYTWSMINNPYIENVEQEIDDICKRKGLTRESPLIQREYLGLIAYDTEAMVFKGYKTYKEIPNEFKPTHIAIGCDWGFADYNAIISLAYNVDTKQSYVIQEKKFNKSTVSDIINECKQSYEYAKDFAIRHNQDFDFSNINFYCDTNEKSITYEMSTTYGLPAYNCYKHDKAMAIAQLAELCRTGRCVIKEGDILSTEFQQTVYKRDEQDNILPEVDDDIFHPDAADALLYASRQMVFDFGENVEEED